MRRSARLAEKQAKLENEAAEETKAEKSRSNDKISTIAAMDNGTMVESFKYLNYCHLAKNSLVTKRFRNLIQTHRHKLALLYVDKITMHPYPIVPDAIKIFNKELSSNAYNEWIIHNNYSKQVPLEVQEDQVASTQSTQIHLGLLLKRYQLAAFAHYKDPNHRESGDRTSVLSALAELNHENWPLFQHFVRLISDSFIYIRCADLIPQNDILNLLIGAIGPDRSHLQCEELYFTLDDNSQKSIIWAKSHVRCEHFFIDGKADLNQDEALLDFVMTGAHCTPSITVYYHDLSKTMLVFLQKFIDLKSTDQSQLVEEIEGCFDSPDVDLFPRYYAEFLSNKEDDESGDHLFEFVNNDVGKKLQLAIKYIDNFVCDFSIQIINF